MALGKPKNTADVSSAKTPAKEVAQQATPQMPASYSLADKIKQDLATIKDQTNGVSVEKVRLSAKGFKSPDGEVSETIEAVVIDFVSNNSHYAAVYDKDNPTPPDCYAMGRNPRELAPVSDLEGTPKDDDGNLVTVCRNCPNNEFGSGPGNSKACKNTRSLALLAGNADADSPIWNMVIPPGSIRYWDTYVNGVLRSKHGVTPVCVLTRFSMDTSNDYASPRMKMVRLLTEEELEFFYSRKAEAEAILLPS